MANHIVSIIGITTGSITSTDPRLGYGDRTYNTWKNVFSFPFCGVSPVPDIENIIVERSIKDSKGICKKCYKIYLKNKEK